MPVSSFISYLRLCYGKRWKEPPRPVLIITSWEIESSQMEQPTITFVVSGNTYSLCAGDNAAISKISAVDRQHLITLLDAVKLQETLSQASVQRAMDKAKLTLRSTTDTRESGSPPAHNDINPERLGSGDVDALMARLIVEEEHNKKPGLTKQGLYKVVAGFAVFVFLLVLIL